MLSGNKDMDRDSIVTVVEDSDDVKLTIEPDTSNIVTEVRL